MSSASMGNSVHMSERDDSQRVGESSLKDLLSGLEEGLDQGKIDSSRTATRVWLKVNGDIERRHTMATFLAEEDGRRILVVYVDSSSLLQDFTTNRLIYRDRLANGGLDVDEVRFGLSKYRRSQPNRDLASSHDGDNDETAYDSLPDVSNDQMEKIEEETSQLPPRLRSAVSKAFVSSVRRSQDPNTDID